MRGGAATLTSLLFPMTKVSPGRAAYHGISRPSSQLMNFPVSSMPREPISWSTRIAPCHLNRAPIRTITIVRGLLRFDGALNLPDVLVLLGHSRLIEARVEEKLRSSVGSIGAGVRRTTAMPLLLSSWDKRTPMMLQAARDM